MKILLVFFRNYFPDRSHRIINEVETLLAAGHQVLVLARKGHHEAQDLYEGKATVFQYEIRSPFGGTLSLISYVLTVAKAPARLLRVALWWKPDAIHVEDLPFSMAAVLVARLMRIPMVLEFRKSFPVALGTDLGYVITGVIGRRLLALVVKISTLLEIVMCYAANSVICISGDERARLVRLGVSGKKFTVIKSYPVLENLPTRGMISRSNETSPMVIYAGHLLPSKGVSLLLEAFKRVLLEFPNAKLVVLGDGPARKGLEVQARKLSLSDRVSFLGWLLPPDAYDLVRASDVCVIPHLVSSMPSKLLTYMHCGKPIVASDFPSVRFVLEQSECGILFQPGDAQDLASALKRVLGDGALRSSLAANAEKAAKQRFNWGNEGRKLVALYSRFTHNSQHTGKQSCPAS